MRLEKNLVCIFLVLLLLPACGQQPVSKTAPTWQEQYDLGMRYLSEGNYAEAILAFTAAIEIDRQRSEAYIGLAKTYVESGEIEIAIQVIEKGIEIVSEKSLLQEYLLELQGNSTLDETDELNSFGGVKFELRSNYIEYDKLELWKKERINEIATAVISEDISQIVGVTRITSDSFSVQTIWNGYKIEVFDSGAAYYEMEIRPETGMGYYVEVRNDVSEELPPMEDDGVSIQSDIVNYMDYTIYSCPCSEWQYNGTCLIKGEESYLYRSWGAGYVTLAQCIKTRSGFGEMIVSLRDGLWTEDSIESSEWKQLWDGRTWTGDQRVWKYKMLYKSGEGLWCESSLNDGEYEHEDLNGYSGGLLGLGSTLEDTKKMVCW